MPSASFHDSPDFSSQTKNQQQTPDPKVLFACPSSRLFHPRIMHLHSILIPLTLAVAASANPIEKRAESTYSISLYSKPDFQGEQSTFTGE